MRARFLRRLIGSLPGARALSSRLRKHYTGCGQPLPDDYPRGHYHSPAPDVADVRRRRDRLFDQSIRPLPGVDLRLDEQAGLLAQLLAAAADFDWPAKPDGSRRFFLDQDWLADFDARVLCGMMRHLRPRQIIEIGSGFSSALMLDVDELYLARQTRFTFIEPRPARLLGLLRNGDRNRCRIIDREAQDVPPDCFADLADGDILFVDSSHVAKVGHDVNYIVFDVLPRLADGVVVHFHDICWPFEYPAEWIERGVAWNEAYILRAFLQFNNQFRIMLFNDLARRLAGDVARRDERLPRGVLGQSLWLRRAGCAAN